MTILINGTVMKTSLGSRGRAQLLALFLGLGAMSSPQAEPVPFAGRWQVDDGVNYYDFLEPCMREYGYEVPARAV